MEELEAGCGDAGADEPRHRRANHASEPPWCRSETPPAAAHAPSSAFGPAPPRLRTQGMWVDSEVISWDTTSSTAWSTFCLGDSGSCHGSDGRAPSRRAAGPPGGMDAQRRRVARFLPKPSLSLSLQSPGWHGGPNSQAWGGLASSTSPHDGLDGTNLHCASYDWCSAAASCQVGLLVASNCSKLATPDVRCTGASPLRTRTAVTRPAAARDAVLGGGTRQACCLAGHALPQLALCGCAPRPAQSGGAACHT